MKGADIKIGCRYLAKVSGRIVAVRVLRETERLSTTRHWGKVPTVNVRTSWECVSEETGRKILVKSAVRFRCPVHAPPAAGVPEEPKSALGIPAVVYEGQADSRADCDAVQVRCSGCGETIPDAVPLAMAASEKPIYCDRCDRDDVEERDAERAADRRFDENDCGGAFDGTNVISDADPGL